MEELVNHFSYDYSRSGGGDDVLQVSTALYPAPWNRRNQLLHIGITAKADDHLMGPRAENITIELRFDPMAVVSYRQIGHVTNGVSRTSRADRAISNALSAGESATVIYELAPTARARRFVDAIMPDARPPEPVFTTATREQPTRRVIANLNLHYDLPGKRKRKRVSVPITSNAEHPSIDTISDDMRFGAAVAAFGQKLRGDRLLNNYSYEDIRRLANTAQGRDRAGQAPRFRRPGRTGPQTEGKARHIPRRWLYDKAQIKGQPARGRLAG